MFTQQNYNRWFFLLLLALATYLGVVLAYFLKSDGHSHSALEYILLGFGALFCAAFLYIVFWFSKAKERERLVLREVFAGSRSARMISDIAGKIIYQNERFLKLRGEDEGAVTSLRALARIFEGNEETLGQFRLLSENAERGSTDTVIVPVELERKKTWLQITAQPISGWAGYIHWRIDDITQQHTMQQVIEEEREKLVRFTDNSPVGFFSVDEDGRFQFVNATLARWLGTDVGTILGEGRLHQYLMTPPGKGARLYDLKSEGGAQQSVETYMKGLGGKTILASISQSVVEEEDGTIRTNAVVHDLTAERQMKKALEVSEDRFKRFFEEAPLGIALVDQQGMFTDVNAGFEAMCGKGVEDIEGKSLLDWTTKESRDEVQNALKNITEGSRLDAPMDVMLSIDGNQRSAQMHARRFTGSELIVLHFIDTTEQKNLEEQFVQSQKMQAVGQLAGGVAHDFNNLLTAMIGFCDLLLLRHKPGDPSFGDISQIKQNANRAANLVRQLLAFSRQQTLRPRVLDVSDTLTELSHLMRRLLGANIDLDVVHGGDLGLIKADEGQMEQVLINLAVNARDAMLEIGSKGQLTIETSNYDNERAVKRGADKMPAGQWVCIAIKDTGCGIPDEIKDRIFEPFFTTKSVGEGTGLGLATVYGIIRQTGGYVHVDSVVGEGTTFYIYLPRHTDVDSNEDDSVTPAVQNEDLTGTATIMLVEDEDAVRTFSARALNNKGYEVIEANGGEQALEIFENDNPQLDLLITDVIMPDMDGPTLAKKVLETHPNLKIIFISGYTEDKFKDDLGDNIVFLPKPFTLQELAAKVKDVLSE